MSKSTESIETLLEQAEALIEEGDYPRAIKCCRRAQAIAPFRQDIRDLLAEAIDGRVAVSSGRLDSDFGASDFAETREGGGPTPRRRSRGRRIGFGLTLTAMLAGLAGIIVVAVALSRSGESDVVDEEPSEISEQATDAIAQVLTVDELLDEARDFLRERNYDDALALLDEAMTLDPEDPTVVNILYSDVYLERGRQQFEANRYQRALRDCERAVEYNPESAGAHYSLGWCHYYLAIDQRNAGDTVASRHEMEAARDAFEQSVALDDSDAKAHRSLGQALIQLGDRGRAFEAWRRAIDVDPGSDAAERSRRALQGYGIEI
jgi:Flp pilus assembly protein TadD